MKDCSNPMCPLTQTLSVIGGKWKPVIIYELSKSPKRFGQLDAVIPGISRKVLTTQLRELHADKLVVRKEYAEAPPRVEYRLTQRGEDLLPIFGAMAEWGQELVKKYKTADA